MVDFGYMGKKLSRMVGMDVQMSICSEAGSSLLRVKSR